MILNANSRSISPSGAKQEQNALFAGMVMVLAAAAAVAVHALAVLGQ